MPRVKFSRRKKPEYIHTELCRQRGGAITCLACGYNGPADLVRSTALGCGALEKCPNCRSLNFIKEPNMVNWKQDEWEGCYPSNWKGMIVPAAMAHPAKFSSRLIRRIYEHMQAEGFIEAGDTVIDPFGGVSLGALEAMRLGLQWRGVELEAKFVELGNWNISNWNAKFHGMPHWNQDSVLLQGDSRRLNEILFSGRAADSSPPYADSVNQNEAANDTDTRLERKANAGIDNTQAVSRGGPHSVLNTPQVYGSTDGQLGAMKGDGFDAAISSPPFEQRSADGGWQMLGKYAEQGKLTVKQVKGDPSKSYPSWDQARDTSYGESEGQLSKMDSGGFDAAIGSPPYADGGQHTGGDDPHQENMQGGVYHGVGMHGSVSSPPYNLPMSQDHNGKRGGTRGTTPSEDGAFVKYGNSDGQLEGMNMDGFQAAVSSPPFRQSEGGTGAQGGTIDPALMKRHSAGNSSAKGYGETDGNLANMDDKNFAAVAMISSPPFAGVLARDGLDADSRRELARGNGISNAEHVSPIDMEKIGKRNQEYGATPGQLGEMGAEKFEAAMISPPYEETTITENANFLSHGKGRKASELRQNGGDAYGDTVGQLGDSGNDFWLAARQIVEQVYLALQPGGHAVWVCKDFVKAKQIVPFSDQWRQLCEAVGFVTLHEHRAMLVHKAGQQTIEGDTVHKKHVSFFRRLAEKKGSPKINFETVWCMVKPPHPSFGHPPQIGDLNLERGTA